MLRHTKTEAVHDPRIDAVAELSQRFVETDENRSVVPSR